MAFWWVIYHLLREPETTIDMLDLDMFNKLYTPEMKHFAPEFLRNPPQQKLGQGSSSNHHVLLYYIIYICSTFGCVKINLGFSSAYCFNPITTGPVIFDRYDGVTKKPLEQTDPMHPFWPPTQITRGKMPHICQGLVYRVVDLALNQSQTLETNSLIPRYHLWLCFRKCRWDKSATLV